MKSSNEYLRCPACKRSIVISWSVFPATGFRFECPRCEIRSWPSRNIKKAWRDWTITHDSDYEIIRACGLTQEGGWMTEKKCMICGESSDDMTWVELTNEEGKVVPATINGVQYDKILMCPNCVLQFFNWFGVKE